MISDDVADEGLSGLPLPVVSIIGYPNSPLAGVKSI
jgi:hypothetical protein